MFEYPQKLTTQQFSQEPSPVEALELVVNDDEGQALEHHPIEMGVLGSALRWTGLSGQGGNVTVPRDVLAWWGPAMSRSPLFLQSVVKDRTLQGPVEFGNLGWSDVAWPQLAGANLSTLAEASPSRLSGANLSSLAKASPSKRPILSSPKKPTVFLKPCAVSLEKLLGEGWSMLCSSSGAGARHLAWLKGAQTSVLVSLGSGGIVGLHAQRREGLPRLMACSEDGRSFLEFHDGPTKPQLVHRTWVEGSGSFWIDQVLGKLEIEQAPRGLMLLKGKDGPFPVVANDSGLTLYSASLRPLHSWGRPGSTQLDLCPWEDGSKFLALDRRSNRQSWLYAFKVDEGHLVVEGVFESPLAVGSCLGGGGLVWDGAQRVLYALDGEKERVLALDLDHGSVVSTKELALGKTVLEHLRQDPSPTLHLIQGEPWLRFVSGLYRVW